MPVEGLDHYNIVCADIERTRAFYCEVLGMKIGPRPPVDSPGYWLYCGGQPQVHLCARQTGGSTAQLPTSACDHVAFRLSDPVSLIAKLQQLNLPFDERRFDAIGVHQVVVRDPEGIVIELNCSP